MIQEVFEKLQNLQDVLLQKYEIESEIRESPKALVIKNELLSRLKKQFIEKNSVLEKKQEKVKFFREKLREEEELRETFEKNMDAIKTQRDYEMLDKAIKESTEREQQLRKDIFKEEKEVEELTSTIQGEEQLIKEQEEELKEEEFRIESKSEERKTVLTELESEEKRIIPGLDPEMLFKFERIIKNKSGLGIVPVKGTVCTGCHMILPSQFVNDVRLGEDLLFCPYCSRILFYVESDDNSFLAFKDSDIGGFSGYDDHEDEDFEENYNAVVSARSKSIEKREADDEDVFEEEEEVLFDEEDSVIFEEEEEDDDFVEEDFEEEGFGEVEIDSDVDGGSNSTDGSSDEEDDDDDEDEEDEEEEDDEEDEDEEDEDEEDYEDDRK